MGASLGQSAAWVMPAVPAVVGQLRHHAAAFAAAAGASDEVTDAIALAVSETVTNVIVHAYDGEEGEVRVSCDVDGEQVIVKVVDYGSGIAAVGTLRGSVMVSPRWEPWLSRSTSLLAPTSAAPS